MSSVIYARLVCHLSKTSGFAICLTSESARSNVCHMCEKTQLAYQQAVKESLEELKNAHSGYGPIPSTSTQYTKIHYTFEFSQQMFIPHHARQIGLIYFLVPRKFQLFGARVDGVPKQYNYLVDKNCKHIETNI